MRWDHEVYLLSAATDSPLPAATKSLAGSGCSLPADVTGARRGLFDVQGEREVVKQSRVMIAFKHTDSPLLAKGIVFHPAWRKEGNCR